MKITLWAALVSSISMVSLANAQGPEPQTFEDCLLKYLPGTASDKAANWIAQACARKFNPWSSSARDPVPSDKKDEWWLDSPTVTDPDLLKQLEKGD